MRPGIADPALLTVPNLLTFGRIAAVPVLVALFYLPGSASAYATFIVFVAASVTDFFDGYLARRLNQFSTLGRILDPIADKLLVAAALIMLAAFDRAPAIAVAAILCREVLIAGLREALAGRTVLHVTMLAKAKTATQMAAIALLLIAPAIGAGWFWAIGEAALWLAVVLSWLSAAGYLRSAWDAVTGTARAD
ncbi:MAG: CDP-diacylglycerol--glycerol-3-phosphate 3-phosphatidyltransferase [Alphaproteobacteria bacterium]|nr:CDP-diacylglycerol--glycerol-3-phosphate 3-phosphatidyltransferase [Alphaproteobacteria bacterium]